MSTIPCHWDPRFIVSNDVHTYFNESPYSAIVTALYRQQRSRHSPLDNKTRFSFPRQHKAALNKP